MRSNHQYKMQTKLTKLNCYKYSFFVKIIKFWNNLPSNVINCHNIQNTNKFKLRFKKSHECLFIGHLILFLMIFFLYIFINLLS